MCSCIIRRKSKSGKVYVYDSSRYYHRKYERNPVTNETKSRYLERYRSGESPSSLGLELFNLGYSRSKGIIGKRSYPGTSLLYNWLYQEKEKMSKKKEKAIEDMPRESLISAINVYEKLVEIAKKRGFVIDEEIKNEIKEEIEKSKTQTKDLLAIFRISKSTYYYIPVPTSESKRAKNNERIDKMVKSCYIDSDQNYGIGRIQTELYYSKDRSITVKKVRNSMKRLNIQSVLKPRRRKRHDPKDPLNGALNLINGNFSSDEPDRVYSTDTSYILSPFGNNGHFYIGALIDLFSYSINGLTISLNNDTNLIMNVYDSIKGKTREGFIIHSDRGSAHLSTRTREWVAEQGGLISVGQCGKSTDNLPIEKFWANIKYEKLYKIPYGERTLERLQKAANEYLEWYHEKRRQKNLGYLTPSMKASSFIKLNKD